MSEDPNREPDGVPHDIVGRTFYVSLLLALATLGALAVASWPGAVLLGVIAIPTIAILLSRKATRERAASGDVPPR